MAQQPCRTSFENSSKILIRRWPSYTDGFLRLHIQKVPPEALQSRNMENANEYRKHAKDQSAQRVTILEETLCNHSERDPCRRNSRQALRMFPVEERPTLVSKCFPYLYPQLCIRVIWQTILMTNIGFVISEMYSQCCGNRTDHKSRVCKRTFIYEILKQCVQRTNVGFATSDSYTKYWRARFQNEYRVRHLIFTLEILQKSYWERT